MKQRIVSRLSEIEEQHDVKILYACESGSRAWGFPSKDSDYDVRFLYLHRVEWYLSLEKRRDVIEYPVEDLLDVNGWDLRKALLLLRKGNPPLLEWLGSPIVYREETSVARKMRELARATYSPVAGRFHYLHMAQKNYRSYLKGPMVRRKKYFYVLRPILAIQWIEKGYGIVPTTFQTLVDTLITDSSLRRDIETLLEEKKQGAELDRGPRIDSIGDFVENALAEFTRRDVRHEGPAVPIDRFDALFLEALSEVWAWPGSGVLAPPP